MRKIICTVFLFSLLFSVNAQGYWQFITGLPLATSLSMETDNSGRVIMAALSGGLYSTTENDSTWHVYGLQGKYIHSLAKDNSGKLYAGTEFEGLLRSDDNFNTYQNLGVTNRFINDIEISEPGLILAATDSGIFVSSNDGLSWNTCGLAGKDIQMVLFSANGFVYALANPGLYKSEDTCKTWQTFSQGFSVPCTVICIYQSSQGELFAGTDSCGIYKYDFNSNAWIFNGLSPYHVTSFHESTQNVLYASTYNGPFYSSNGGNTWILLGDTLDRDNLTRIFISDNGYAYVNVCCGYGFYKSVVSTFDASDIQNQACGEDYSQEVRCFPNPLTGENQLWLIWPESDYISIKLFDSGGRLVYSGITENRSNSINLSIENVDIPKGAYYLNVNSDQLHRIFKLIKF